MTNFCASRWAGARVCLFRTALCSHVTSALGRVYLWDDEIRTRRHRNQTEQHQSCWRRRTMSGTMQRRAESAVTDRYEALLRVSQTLISIRSLEELFRLLARELRAVVNFYVVGLGIYDEKTHEIRLTSYSEPGDPLQVPKFAPE